MTNHHPQYSKSKQVLLWTVFLVLWSILILVIIAASMPQSDNRRPEIVDSLNASLNANKPTEIPVSPPAEPKVAVKKDTCFKISDIKFTENELTRLNKIILFVMQGDDNMPTAIIYNEFWSIINRHGKLCEEASLADFKYQLTAATECTKLFYQDALYSLTIGQAYKSQQRLDCENYTIRALRPPDVAEAIIEKNDEMIRLIASGQPIQTSAGDYIFTADLIQSTINNINAKLEKVNKLFTAPYNGGTSVTQKSGQNISAGPDLDRHCEEIHGPSVYKSLSKSIGGGSYCECIPGYTLELTTAADGSPSSWCFKD